MILDTLDNAALYRQVHPLFARAFDWIHKTDLTSLSEGRHEILGDDLVALVNSYDTKPEAGARAESHRKYIDIQTLISGVERIGRASLAGISPVEKYAADKDIAFYETPCSFFTVTPGLFAIFFPGDIHLPCISLAAPTPVRKLVIKVKV